MALRVSKYSAPSGQPQSGADKDGVANAFTGIKTVKPSPSSFSSPTQAKSLVQQFRGHINKEALSATRTHSINHRFKLASAILAQFKPIPSEPTQLSNFYKHALPELVTLLREIAVVAAQAGQGVDNELLRSIFGDTSVDSDLKALLFLHLVSTSSADQVVTFVNQFKEAGLTLPSTASFAELFSKKLVGDQNGFAIFDSAIFRLDELVAKDLREVVYSAALPPKTNFLGVLYNDGRQPQTQLRDLFNSVEVGEFRGSTLEHSLPVQTIVAHFKSGTVDQARFGDNATKVMNAVLRGHLHPSVLVPLAEAAMNFGQDHVGVEASILFYETCPDSAKKSDVMTKICGLCKEGNRVALLPGMIPLGTDLSKLNAFIDSANARSTELSNQVEAPRVWDSLVNGGDLTFASHVDDALSTSRASGKHWGVTVAAVLPEKILNKGRFNTDYKPAINGDLDLYEVRSEDVLAVRDHLCKPMVAFEVEFQTALTARAFTSERGALDLSTVGKLKAKLEAFKVQLDNSPELKDVKLATKRYISEAKARLDAMIGDLVFVTDHWGQLYNRFPLVELNKGELATFSRQINSAISVAQAKFDKPNVGVKTNKPQLREFMQGLERQYHAVLSQFLVDGKIAGLTKFLNDTLIGAPDQFRQLGDKQSLLSGSKKYVKEGLDRLSAIRREVSGLLDGIQRARSAREGAAVSRVLRRPPGFNLQAPSALKHAVDQKTAREKIGLFEAAAQTAPLAGRTLDESIVNMQTQTSALSSTWNPLDCEELLVRLDGNMMANPPVNPFAFGVPGSVQQNQALSIVLSRLANTLEQMFPGPVETLEQAIVDAIGPGASDPALAKDICHIISAAIDLLNHPTLGFDSFRTRAVSGQISTDAHRLSVRLEALKGLIAAGKVNSWVRLNAQSAEFEAVSKELLMHQPLASDVSKLALVAPDQMLANCHARAREVRDGLTEMMAFVELAQLKGVALPAGVTGTPAWMETVRMVLRQYEAVLKKAEALPGSDGIAHLTKDQVRRLNALDIRLNNLVGAVNQGDRKPNITAFFAAMNTQVGGAAAPLEQAAGLADVRTTLNALKQKVNVARDAARAQDWSGMLSPQLSVMERTLSYQSVLDTLERDLKLAEQQHAAGHPLSAANRLQLVQSIAYVQLELDQLAPIVARTPFALPPRTMTAQLITNMNRGILLVGDLEVELADIKTQLAVLDQTKGSLVAEERRMGLATLLLSMANAASVNPVGADLAQVTRLMTFVHDQLNDYLPKLSLQNQLKLGQDLHKMSARLGQDLLFAGLLADDGALIPPVPGPAYAPGVEALHAVYFQLRTLEGVASAASTARVQDKVSDNNIKDLLSDISLGRSTQATQSRAVSLTEQKALLERQMGDVLLVLVDAHHEIAQLKGVFYNADVAALQAAEAKFVKTVAERYLSLMSSFRELGELPLFNQDPNGYADSSTIAQSLNAQLLNLFSSMHTVTVPLGNPPVMTLKSGRDQFSVDVCRQKVAGFDATAAGSSLALASTGVSVSELHTLAAVVPRGTVSTLTDTERRARIVEIFTPALGKGVDSPEFKQLETHLAQLTSVENARLLTLVADDNLFNFSKTVVGLTLATRPQISGNATHSLRVILGALPTAKAISQLPALSQADFDGLSYEEQRVVLATPAYAQNQPQFAAQAAIDIANADFGVLAEHCVSQMSQNFRAFSTAFDALPSARKSVVMMSLLEYDSTHGTDVVLSYLGRTMNGNFGTITAFVSEVDLAALPAAQLEFSKSVVSSIQYLTGPFVDHVQAFAIANALPADNGLADVSQLLGSAAFIALLTPQGVPAATPLNRDQVLDILSAVAQRYSLAEVLTAAPAILAPLRPALGLPAGAPLTTADVFTQLIDHNMGEAVKSLRKLDEAALGAVLNSLDNAGVQPTLRARVMAQLFEGRTLSQAEIGIPLGGVAVYLLREIATQSSFATLAEVRTFFAIARPRDFGVQIYSVKNWMMTASKEDIVALFSNRQTFEGFFRGIHADDLSQLLEKTDAQGNRVILDAVCESLRKLQHSDFALTTAFLDATVFHKLFPGGIPIHLETAPGGIDTVDQFKLLVAMKADVSQGNITLFKARFDEFSPQVLLNEVIPYLRSIQDVGPVIGGVPGVPFSPFELAMEGLLPNPPGTSTHFDLPFFSKLIKHVGDEAVLSRSLGIPSCANLMVATPFVAIPAAGVNQARDEHMQAFAVATAISEIADGTFSWSGLQSRTLFSNLLQTLAHYHQHCPRGQQPLWLTNLMDPQQKGKWADAINQVFGDYAGFCAFFPIAAPGPSANTATVMAALNGVFDLVALVRHPGLLYTEADCVAVKNALKPRIEASKVAQKFDAFSADTTSAADRAQLQATALAVFGVDYANPNPAALLTTSDDLIDALAQPGRGHALFKSVQGGIPPVNQRVVFTQWIAAASSPFVFLRFADPIPVDRSVLFVKDIIADVVATQKTFTKEDRETLHHLIASLSPADQIALFDQLLIGGPPHDEAKLLKDLILKLIPKGKADAKNPSVVAFFKLVTDNASSSANAVVLKVMSDKGLKIKSEMRTFVTRFRHGLHANPIDLNAFRDLLDVFNIESDAQFRDELFSALSPADLTVLLAQLRTGMGSRQGDAFLDGAKTWMQDRLDVLAKSKETADDRDKFKAILEEMMFLPGVGVTNAHSRDGYTHVGQAPVRFASSNNVPSIPRRGVAATRDDVGVIDYDRSQLTKFLWSLSTDGINLLRDHFEFTQPLVQMMGADHYLALTTKRNKQSSDLKAKAAAHAKKHIEPAFDEALKTLNADARDAYGRRDLDQLVEITRIAINAGMGRRFLMSSLGLNVGPVIKYLVANAMLDAVLADYSLQDPISLMLFLTEKPYNTRIDLTNPAGPQLLPDGNKSSTSRAIHTWLVAPSRLNPAETNWERLVASEQAAKAELEAARTDMFADRNYGGDRE